MGKSIGKLISFQHQNQDSFLRGKKRKEKKWKVEAICQNKIEQNKI